MQLSRDGSIIRTLDAPLWHEPLGIVAGNSAIFAAAYEGSPTQGYVYMFGRLGGTS